MEKMLMRFSRFIILVAAVAVTMGGAGRALAQNSSTESPTGFAPLDQWRSAILAGDAATLKALYSADPEARVQAADVKGGADSDITFWHG